VIQEISKRQEEIMLNKHMHPLIIFPEGGTTNGQYIIKFKKGAFVSLLPIWPKVIKFRSMF
jgi:lysophosphatidylcholine acyltransferase / lyso-PAF acetyltransferase